MAEYIEREALREAFIKHFDAVYDNGKLVFSDNICSAEDCEDILKLVAELPTADVVPVVRCKDCVYCVDLGTSGLYCDHDDNRNPLGCRPNDYCNDGERRGSNE